LFENSVLRKILGRNREKVTGTGEDYITLSCMICIPYHMLFGWSKQAKWDRRDVWHVWLRGEVQTGVWWGNLMERDRFEDLGVDGSITLKWILNCLGGCVLVWSGSGQGQM